MSIPSTPTLLRSDYSCQVVVIKFVYIVQLKIKLSPAA